MQRLLLVGLAAAALMAAPSVAEAGAMTALSVPSNDAITLVEGGCGPGGFRAINGACYRRPPPRLYYRRACPPGLHLTRFGCRRNF